MPHTCVKFLFCVIVGLILAQCHVQGRKLRPYIPEEMKSKPDKSTLKPRENRVCSLPKVIVDNIQSYKSVADKIIESATQGKWKGRTYDKLAHFVDKFGHRMTGFDTLEKSIDFMEQYLKEFGLEVSLENVTVPMWTRGAESVEMISPRTKKMAVLGLGNSIGTNGTIEADVIVFKNFEEMEARSSEIQGKIVVFNQDWVSYGVTNQYRTTSATKAAVYGAAATLIKSIAPFSLDTPHTGGQTYGDPAIKIPTACITHEDADLMWRMQQRNETIRLKLILEDLPEPDKFSSNVIGDIKGSDFPDEIVAVSGHIDSWDVGQGAMDDGGGVYISVEALGLIKDLNLTPKRTLRVILWTAEEVGLIGVRQYVDRHVDELEKWNAVFESDGGTFDPLGLDFAGSPDAGCIIQEILKLCEPIRTTEFRAFERVSSDITLLQDKGVPGLSNNNANEQYFWFHHTEADTMDIEDSEELDRSTAMWALSSYILADMEVKLPRGEASNWLVSSSVRITPLYFMFLPIIFLFLNN